MLYNKKVSDDQENQNIEDSWLLPTSSPELRPLSQSVPIGGVSPYVLEMQRLASFSSGFRVLPQDEVPETV